MTPDERRVLEDALSSLSSVELDLHVYAASDRREVYNYDAVGRTVMGKRLLSEILGTAQYHLLPGEFFDEDSEPGELLRFSPSKRSEDGEPLNQVEKKWLQTIVLPTLLHIYGLSDADAGSLRCITRRVAEVSGYPDLERFGLLRENEVTPLFLKVYQPFFD